MTTYTWCEIILQNYLQTRDIELYSNYKIVNNIIYYKYDILFYVYSNSYLKYDKINIKKNYNSSGNINYYNNKNNNIQNNNILYIKNIKIIKNIKTKILKYYNYLFKMYKKICINKSNEIHFKYFYSKIKSSIICIYKYYSSSNIYICIIKNIKICIQLYFYLSLYII